METKCPTFRGHSVALGRLSAYISQVVKVAWIRPECQVPMRNSTFLDRLIERMDRLDPSSLQSYILRLVREKGFLETGFNRSEERRVGRECRFRWSPDKYKTKREV